MRVKRRPVGPKMVRSFMRRGASFGLGGIVSKRARSFDRSGPSRNDLKTKPPISSGRDRLRPTLRRYVSCNAHHRGTRGWPSGLQARKPPAVLTYASRRHANHSALIEARVWRSPPVSSGEEANPPASSARLANPRSPTARLPRPAGLRELTQPSALSSRGALQERAALTRVGSGL